MQANVPAFLLPIIVLELVLVLVLDFFYLADKGGFAPA
jgi:hypothetical protein